MAFLSRAFGASLLVPLILVTGHPAMGQQAGRPAPAARPATTAVDTRPWLYEGSDIPPDPAWQFGTLPNGLRYAVRRNGVPPGQVSVRVRIDAGSLHESDSERGFAHFLEHLSFRASKYVPDGEAKRVWQNFGATFGSDTNATTSPVSTTYKLDLPSATADRLDQSLKILSGMLASPVLDDKTIAAERPVVLSEQREQPGPQVRFSDLRNRVFFAGQPLAERSPIGSIKTLEAASATSVRAFHDRWYRPSRTLVVISGDMDPAIFGQLVAKNFAGWQGVGPNPVDPDFGKPVATAPTTGALAEPGLPTVVQLGVVRPWTFNADTVVFNQKRLVDVLATRVMNRRLEARARAGGSYLQASVELDDIARSANMTMVTVLPVGTNWEAALADVRAVIADAQATPPSQAEVDREYADFDTIMRQEADTARVAMGSKLADDMVEALDIRETTTTAAASYQILKGAHAKGMFTPAAIFESSKRLFQGTATRAVVVTPVAQAEAPSKLAAALAAPVSTAGVTRRQQAAVTFAALPALGAPGKVVSRETLPDLDMEQVTFANGVRMLLFPFTSETGRVYVRARFGGGYGQLPAKRGAPIWAGDIALVASGIGKLDQGDLDQLTAGRVMGLDFGIDQDAFSFSAMTSPADLPDQLRLMAAKLARPGWDPAPVARARAVKLAAFAGQDASPTGVLSRDLEGLLRDGDPRWSSPSRAEIEALSPKAFRALWEPVLASGPLEISVFGDVKADAAITAVAASFGALPPRAPAKISAAPSRFPAHRASPVRLTHSGAENQAVAVIAWPTGGGVDAIGDSRRLDVLSQVFSDRLFERLRQTAGASYSPSVGSQWPIGAASGGRMLAVGQVTPDKTGYFFQLAREIAADLVANRIPDEELQRILRPMGQYIVRVSSGNQFWLQQMAGAAYDPKRVTATRTMMQDFVSITPEQLQAIAAKYLRPDKDWTLEVVPKAVAR
ncbi:M16 family metallopeptidase [Sphingomonas sp.]|jgi:zinc protease|uniref:M16 family metallopeptidase n=1 Tax=Sphingomonas sp. TaxID=28214 RepID=UPI002D807051|nr:insulinase family protein [Sphingomonas sp.]HEU0043005.1 insulinase family protein [Sphingomonas sp.]